VLDIFGGSNTTGYVCEGLDRKWLAFDLSQDYLKSSIFRFMSNASHDEIKRVLDTLHDTQANLRLDIVDVTLPAPAASEAAATKHRKVAQGSLFG